MIKGKIIAEYAMVLPLLWSITIVMVFILLPWMLGKVVELVWW